MNRYSPTLAKHSDVWPREDAGRRLPHEELCRWFDIKASHPAYLHEAK